MTLVVFFAKRITKQSSPDTGEGFCLSLPLRVSAPIVGGVQVPPTFPGVYRETSYVELLKPKLTHMPSQGRVAFPSHAPDE